MIKSKKIKFQQKELPLPGIELPNLELQRAGLTSGSYLSLGGGGGAGSPPIPPSEPTRMKTVGKPLRDLPLYSYQV